MSSLKYLYLAVCLSLTGCGLVGLGSGSSNDPAPSGTIVYSGSFESNSSNISGIVYVYHQSGTTYTVRLESFSSDTVSNLKVQGFVSSSTVALDSSLKSTSGNQNYSASGVSSTNWSSVKIVTTAVASPNNVLATALLDSVL